jgi:hypothetical protein
MPTGNCGEENRKMYKAMHKFIEAHDRYLALDSARTVCDTPQQRETMYIEIMTAYLEVQYRANQIAGLQYADGWDFADVN